MKLLGEGMVAVGTGLLVAEATVQLAGEGWVATHPFLTVAAAIVCGWSAAVAFWILLGEV